jgi:hypothetical protein
MAKAEKDFVSLQTLMEQMVSALDAIESPSPFIITAKGQAHDRLERLLASKESLIASVAEPSRFGNSRRKLLRKTAIRFRHPKNPGDDDDDEDEDEGDKAHPVHSSQCLCLQVVLSKLCPGCAHRLVEVASPCDGILGTQNVSIPEEDEDEEAGLLKGRKCGHNLEFFSMHLDPLVRRASSSILLVDTERTASSGSEEERYKSFKRNLSTKYSGSVKGRGGTGLGSSEWKSSSMKEWEINYSDLVFEEKVGEGTFGMISTT